MKRILIIGATSAIAQEFARIAAGRGSELFLVARKADRLNILAADLKARGAGKVATLVADANDFEQNTSLAKGAVAELGGLDAVLIAHGVLGDQRASERDFRLAEAEYKTNFLSVVSLMTTLAAYFEDKKRGVLAVISSVAGDRGRQSNFIYGSAKGALSLYLAGLRNRLYPSGVAVLTIKPGFVDTPMTAHLKKGLLFASPGKVARDIYRAMEKRRDVLYTPGIWFWIMFIIRMVPERIFKRLKL
jgi:short-subunit dehydrogenase